jgi:hypothetical protein
MSRSGYSEDYCDAYSYHLYRSAVNRAIAGKRGQAFLREFIAAMDAMPVKELAVEELMYDDGSVCALGVVCKARGITPNFKMDDYENGDGAKLVGKLLGIARSMAAEIAHENDEGRQYWPERIETPGERWGRMRMWAEMKLRGP